MGKARAKRTGREVYVVITPSRVFSFGSHKTALTFLRRVERLPSMRGQTVEFVPTRMFKGARRFASPLVHPEWPTVVCGATGAVECDHRGCWGACAGISLTEAA